MTPLPPHVRESAIPASKPTERGEHRCNEE